MEFNDFIQANGRVKRGTWEKVENHKLYLDWLGKILDYKTMEDWYNITQKLILNNNGRGILKYYNSSHQKLLSIVYSQYKWLPWKFIRTLRHYWDNYENHIIFIESLREHLNYKNMEDCYKITYKDIEDYGGEGLLVSYYNSSPQQLLSSVYKEHEWLSWKFIRTQREFWYVIENHKLFLEWLFKKLNYNSKDDWYKITGKLITKYDGGGILQYYNGSPQEMLTKLYPENKWFMWKFICAPNNYWGCFENRKSYIEWLFMQLNYKTIEDWYKITKEIITNNYGGGILRKYNGSPCKLLTHIYPDFNWDKTKFAKSYSLGQIQWLEFQMVSIPDIRHILNSNEGEFRIPNTNYLADGFSTITNTDFEYHGDFWHGNPKIYERDKINPLTKTTYGELYDNTLKREQEIRNAGINVISVWESDWLRGIKSLITLQRICRLKIMYK